MVIEIINKPKSFVLSGGPGAGKTTILNILAKRGYKCVEESGRAIIQTQVDISGPILPWKDPIAYATADHMTSMLNFRNTNPQELTFFDRGIIDPIGFLNLMSEKIPPYFSRAAKKFRYNKIVFIVPPWEEIYLKDNERKQDFGEAVATFHMMKEAYTKFEYDIVEVPIDSPQNRATFITENAICSSN